MDGMSDKATAILFGRDFLGFAAMRDCGGTRLNMARHATGVSSKNLGKTTRMSTGWVQKLH
jgi:hypothetical protein